MSTGLPEEGSDARRRGRPKRLSDSAQRDRLFTAAMNAFIERGFARTTTADVASRAKVSKRDLYRLFADKTELFLEAVKSRRHLIVDLPRPSGESLPPLEALRLIFRLDLNDREADERDALLSLMARESLLSPELNALFYDSGIVRSRELLVEWLDAQIARNALPACDAGNIAGLLMDVVFGALLPRRQRKTPIDRSVQAAEIMVRLEIVLRGLERMPRRSAAPVS